MESDSDASSVMKIAGLRRFWNNAVQSSVLNKNRKKNNPPHPSSVYFSFMHNYEGPSATHYNVCGVVLSVLCSSPK